jgi:competence protein ComFC
MLIIITYMHFLNTILDIVFPVNCLFCGEKGSDLCTKCLLDSPSAERESANWIFPLFDYRHSPIKKSIWLLKYKGKKRIAGIFAEIIYDKMIEELSELSVMKNFREPILIPIPLSKKRYRERGYNQAELICQELMKINNLRHGVDMKLEKNILVKIKETEHQANIKDRRERLKNLSDSFSIKNLELIKNKNVILIDDVTTTGATLTEAKKILKQFGAKKIIAFTVAH